jgi:uncharacterized protein
LSHGSPYAAFASFFLSRPHISLEDTFNPEQVRLYMPFTDVILSGDYIHPLKSNKLLTYNGYHELAYLHPNCFRPNEKVLKDLGVGFNDKFVILRFVSWTASHDKGHKGISDSQKIKIVKELSKFAKVFISSEKPLIRELSNYAISIPPDLIHSAIAFSSLLFGESATMASEAAMLGVPSIYIDKKGRYYTRDIEKKYNLIYNYNETDFEQKLALEKAIEILKQKNLSRFKKAKNLLLGENIDLSSFLIWFVENFPESHFIMKINPDFQKEFVSKNA